jgi:tripartite-type tricarboxylate transporter receptor subunit TctC
MLRAAALIALAGLSALSAQAQAQEFPNRAIRMMHINAAGSTSDIHARILAHALGDALGQPVIVDNNAGAGGLLAQRAAFRATPLGYTLLYTTNSLVGNLHAYTDPLYRLEDYALIGTSGLAPYAIMVHSTVPGSNLKEFLAYVKANPGKLNFGSPGPSSGANILAERLKAAAGLDMQMIPFKGGDPATTAMLAGQIQVYFSTVGAVRNRIKGGQIKTFAVAGTRRSELFPDLPTFREAGFPTVTLNVWNAVFVASAAPAPYIQKLREGFSKAAASREHMDYLKKGEYETWRGTLDEFMTYIKSEGEAIGEDYKRLNLPRE